jgi:hypothetical protein
MSLGMTLVMLIAAWLAVAGAMLWGVMRISRRHQPHHRNRQATTPEPLKNVAPMNARKSPHAGAH